MSISMKKVNSNGVPRHHEHSDRSNGGMWIFEAWINPRWKVYDKSWL